MVLAKMIREEGNDIDALIGCLRAAYKCSLMGPPWAVRHPQTERMEYVLLEFGFQESFEQCWSIFKEEFNDRLDIRRPKQAGRPPSAISDGAALAGDGGASSAGHGGASAGHGGAAAGGNGGSADDKPKCKAAAKAQSKARGKEPKEKVKLTQEQQTLVDLQKAADKMKVAALQHTSAALGILQQIEDSTEWQWAKNEQNQGELSTKLNDFKGALNEFGRAYMVQKCADIKKRWGQAHLTVELNNFLAAKPKLDALEKELQVVLKRHNVS